MSEATQTQVQLFRLSGFTDIVKENKTNFNTLRNKMKFRNRPTNYNYSLTMFW